VTANGYPVNGTTLNGYPQPDQGTGPQAALNGLVGQQQYTQPAQPAPVTGYQQAPPQQAPPQQAPPQQALAPSPATAVQQPQFGQPGQAAPGPAFAPTAQPVPSAPSVTVPLTAPPSAPQPLLQPPLAAEPVAAQPAVTQQATTQPLSAPLATTAPPVQAPAVQAPAAPAPGIQAATPAPPAADTTGPLTTLPPAPPLEPSGAHAAPVTGGTLSKLTGAVRGRRAARKPRLAMSAIFADLVDMADIPRSAYAVDEEITGAMCLFKTDGGYEVFSCAEDARHEVRFFEEEEAAYFYLFGVLAAEALRNGRLSPRRS
jgi:hypothetical protein